MTHWDTAATTRDGARDAVWAASWDDATLARCCDLLAPAFPAGGCVVEVGCGVGRLTVPLAERHPGCHLVGYDPSIAMLRWTPRHPRITWRPLLYTEGRVLFDGAYSMVVLQHLAPDAQEAYQHRMAALLRPGAVWRFQWVTDGDEGPLAHPVDVATMVAWCEAAGFDVAAVEHGFGPDPWPWGWITAVRHLTCGLS